MVLRAETALLSPMNFFSPFEPCPRQRFQNRSTALIFAAMVLFAGEALGRNVIIFGHNRR